MDIAALPWGVITQGGAVALLFFVAGLLFTGKLVSAASLQREREISNKFEGIADKAMERGAKQEEALRAALEGLSSMNYLVRVVRQIVEEGPSDVVSPQEGRRDTA